MPTAQKLVRPPTDPRVRLAKAARRSAPPLRRGSRNANTAVARGTLPIIILIVSALTILPTAIVATVGLVPSLAALVVDDTRQRYLFRSVLGMNLAALWPFLERLWLHGNDVRAAVGIIADIYTWAAIYGAAGVGWLMFSGLPAMVASYKQYAATRRIEKLTASQEKLREEWGSVLPQLEEEPAKVPAKAEASG